MFVYGLNEDEANDILAMLDGSRSAPERMIAKKRAQEEAEDEFGAGAEPGMASWKLYECTNCGHKDIFSTNHKATFIAYCKNCSWKPSEGVGFPFNGRTYRKFKFVSDDYHFDNVAGYLEGAEEETAVKSSRKADKAEDKPGDEHPLEELGEIADGKDIAEVPMDDMPFQIGDSVTLTKAYELALWGGATDELPKGMKGTIKNLYDGHGDYYMVKCEEGGVYRIPTEYLK
jgi:hypothetical protein